MSKLIFVFPAVSWFDFPTLASFIGLVIFFQNRSYILNYYIDRYKQDIDLFVWTRCDVAQLWSEWFMLRKISLSYVSALNKATPSCVSREPLTCHVF